MSSASTEAHLKVTVIRPRSGWVAVDWHELWDSREILFFLVWRDVTVRYKQTVLGVAWAVIQPVFSMMVFAVIFGRLAGMPSDGDPYPVFVYCGLLPWTFFTNSVAAASQSLVNQQALLTKVYLPRLFIPASSIGGNLIDFGISFGVLLVLMLTYGIGLSWTLLWLPVLTVLTAVTALGIGLVLAALTVTYRDFRYVTPFLLQLWLYASPVIYPPSMVPENWRWLLNINPMTGIIEAFRASVLGKPLDAPALSSSVVVSLLVLGYALFYFRKAERRFADVA